MPIRHFFESRIKVPRLEPAISSGTVFLIFPISDAENVVSLCQALDAPFAHPEVPTFFHVLYYVCSVLISKCLFVLRPLTLVEDVSSGCHKVMRYLMRQSLDDA